jgi:hypothetical protein
MRTFLLKIVSETDSNSVMRILNDLLIQKHIELNVYSNASVAPSPEQVKELIEESELGPYYSEQEVKDILNL